MVRRVLAVLACIAATVSANGCGQNAQPPPGSSTQPPAHNALWLSAKFGFCTTPNSCQEGSISDLSESDRYYQGIGAEDSNGNPVFNLAGWKQVNGFPAGGTTAHAVYGNKLDLQFGRDMYCWQSGQNVACYVTNYGPAPFDLTNNVENNAWPNLESAVDDAINGNNPGATVAMVYNPNGIGINSDPIAFYVFDPNGNLLNFAALDGEGKKAVPMMCMSCHGGSYNFALHSVPAHIATGSLGTSFLPFDVWSFYYSQNINGHDLDSQQEGFRQLNAFVLQTNPSPAIASLVNGLYSNNVTTPGATIPDDSYVQASWITPDKNGQKVYKGVFRKYCRMCHLSQDYPDFSTFPNQFAAGQMVNAVCNAFVMPHAEVPFGGLAGSPKFGAGGGTGFWWDSTAPADLNILMNEAVGGPQQNYPCPAN